MADCAAVYADEANKLMLLGFFEDAASNLTYAMQLQPLVAELRVRRAGAMRLQGKLQEAILDLERAISDVGGKYPEASRMLELSYNDLGLRLASQQLHADALRWFGRCILANGNEAAFYLNRSDCQQALGNTTEALEDLKRAKDLCSHDAQLQWSIRTRLAIVRLCHLYSAHPRRHTIFKVPDMRVVTVLKHLSRTNLFFIQVYNDRGAQLFNHADARRSVVEFSHAIECHPKVPAFFVNRAEALMQLARCVNEHLERK